MLDASGARGPTASSTPSSSASRPRCSPFTRAKRADFSLEEIGLPAQVALFERAADRLGRAPPVIEGAQALADPRGTLAALCEACGLAFDEAMLAWPPGRRASDGVWAPAWYEAVERSTGFGPPQAEARFEDLPDGLKRLAEAARPLYERLARHRLATAAGAAIGARFPPPLVGRPDGGSRHPPRQRSRLTREAGATPP